MITSDRDEFVGAHVTLPVKEGLKKEAAARKMSVSALLAEIAEKWLASPTPDTERRRSNRRITPVNPNEQDVPLPGLDQV